MRKRRPEGFCPLCDIWRYSLHRDHIVPKWKGGAVDDPANWQYICANCHEDKTREELMGHTLNRGIKRPYYYRPNKHTPEHCLAISKALTGRIISPETRAKISASRMGQRTGPMPPEVKAKLSKSRLAYWDAVGGEERRIMALRGWVTRRGRRVYNKPPVILAA